MKNLLYSSKFRNLIRFFVALFAIATLLYFLSPAGTSDSSINSIDSQPITGKLLSIVLPIVTLVFSVVLPIFGSLADATGLSLKDWLPNDTPNADIDNFPFEVANSYEHLLEILFPNPTKPVLPDRDIHYMRRSEEPLDTALSRNQRLLVRGRSKTGKSREVAELLHRHWHNGATVLVVNRHAVLTGTYDVPDSLPRRNLILVIDDVDNYCRGEEATRNLERTISFFENLCQDRDELRVIATVRQEYEFWNNLHYDESSELWQPFHLVTIPLLSPREAEHLILQLSHVCQFEIARQVVTRIAQVNDGTFLNILLTVRDWIARGRKSITMADADNFVHDLEHTWSKRYKRICEEIPAAPAIYGAAHFLERSDIPIYIPALKAIAEDMFAGRKLHSLMGASLILREKKQNLLRQKWLENIVARIIIQFGFVNFGMIYATFLFVLLYSLPIVLFISQSIRSFIPSIVINSVFFVSLFLGCIAMGYVIFIKVTFMIWRHSISKVIDHSLTHLLRTEFRVIDDKNIIRGYEGQFGGFCFDERNNLLSNTAFESQGFLEQLVCRSVNGGILIASYRLRDGLNEIESSTKFLSLQINRWEYLKYTYFRFKAMVSEKQRHFGTALRCLEKAMTYSDSSFAKANNLLDSGWIYFRLGNYDLATQMAEESLIYEPYLSSNRWLRGLTYLQQGKSDEGIEECRYALLLNPFIPPVVQREFEQSQSVWWSQFLSRLGRNARQKQKNSKLFELKLRYGVILFWLLFWLTAFTAHSSDRSKFLQSNMPYTIAYPFSSTAWFAQGQRNFNLGNYGEAIESLSSAIKIDPHYARAYGQRGISYGEIGDLESAIEDLSRTIDINPDYAWAYVERGIVYRLDGNTESALDDFTSAIEAAPNYAAPYLQRGITNRVLDKFDLAIEDLSKAIEINPDYAQAYSERGIVHRIIGNRDNAIEDLSQAIEILPDYARAYVERGIAQRHVGNNDSAIEDLSQAIEILPNYAWAYVERGIAHWSNENNESAYEDLTKAISIDPEYARAYFQRAEFYYFDGDNANALKDLTKTISIDPNYFQVYFGRGEIYSELGEYELAVANYSEAIANAHLTTWRTVEGLYASRGVAYYRMGSHESAIADFMFQTETNTDTQPQQQAANRLLNLANVYIDESNYEAAKVAFAQAVQLDPELTIVPTAEILKSQGRNAAIEQDIETALSLYNQANQESENYALSAEYQVAEILLRQIGTYLDQDKMLKAESAILEALKLAPDFEDARSKEVALLFFDICEKSFKLEVSRGNDEYCVRASSLAQEEDAVFNLKLCWESNQLAVLRRYFDPQCQIARNEAIPLSFDEYDGGIIWQDQGEIWYFSGDVGETVIIEMTRDEDSTLDSYLTLYDPSMVRLDVDNNGGGNSNSQIEFTIEETGNHYILAEGNFNSWGTYKLQISRLDMSNEATSE